MDNNSNIIYFDVTLVIDTLLKKPTGIIRYERTLFLSLVNSGQIEFIYFNKKSDCFLLSDEAKKFLENFLKDAINSSDESIKQEFHANNSMLFLKPLRRQFFKKLREIDRYSSYSTTPFLKKISKYFLLYICSLIPYKNKFFLKKLNIEKLIIILSFFSILKIRKCSDHRIAKIISNSHVIYYDTVPMDLPETMSEEMNNIFPRALKFVFEKSRGLLPISAHTAENLEIWKNKFKIDRLLNINIIPSSSNLKRIVRKYIQIESLKNRKFVLFCSTIEPRKNHRLLIDIWDDILCVDQNIPDLILVGSVGWKSEVLVSEIRRHKYYNKKIFLFENIQDSELAWLYKNCLFCVFPSLDEGWGLSATEALDFGKPIIISKVPALLEATQALMPSIDAKNFDDWKEFIIKLINNENIIAELEISIRKYYKRTSDREIIFFFEQFRKTEPSVNVQIQENLSSIN